MRALHPFTFPVTLPSRSASANWKKRSYIMALVVAMIYALLGQLSGKGKLGLWTQKDHFPEGGPRFSSIKNLVLGC